MLDKLARKGPKFLSATSRNACPEHMMVSWFDNKAEMCYEVVEETLFISQDMR